MRPINHFIGLKYHIGHFNKPYSVHCQYYSNQLDYQATARLAQSVEHETLNLRVVGSSPTLGGYIFLNFSL